MIGLDAIKAATWELHVKAERSGIIADIIAGRASRPGLALLLRNLLPVYQVLDHSPYARPALARSAAIAADLQRLSPDAEPPLLAEGQAYALRVRHAAKDDGNRLIAHAYVRYLGDLNGGQLMKRRLMRALGGAEGSLTAFDYPGLPDTRAFSRTYREELDQAARSANLETLVQEALAAFALNIALSDAVKTIAG
jgi:heme oxygenase (biliverdin-producing, ferredoxin)